MNNDKMMGICLIILLFGSVIGYMAGSKDKENYFKRETIKHGCAQYNSTNGVWEWKANTTTNGIVK